jgi:hypothetical protein
MIREREEVCAHCQNFHMKDYPEHAAKGEGRCSGYDEGFAQLRNPFVRWDTPACAVYTKAIDIRTRREWIERRRAKEKQNEVQPDTKG